MASFFSRRVVRNLGTGKASRASFCPTRRTIYATPSVQKKRIVDDIFEKFDGNDNDDLISLEPHAKVSTSSPAASTSKSASSQNTKLLLIKPKLTPAQRLQRMEETIAFIQPRLGRKPTITTPPARNTVWLQLFDLTTSEEQLKRVVDLLPGWKDSGREVTDQISERFIERCDELACPLLAVEVFGDYSKYSMRLTLPGARRLLHALYAKHSLDKIVMVTSFYGIYKLPPVSQDLISCAFVISACYRHNTRDSLVVAESLLPRLQKLVEASEPILLSDEGTAKATKEYKFKTWLKLALKSIDNSFYMKTRERAEWLNDFRRKSGHLPSLSS